MNRIAATAVFLAALIAAPAIAEDFKTGLLIRRLGSEDTEVRKSVSEDLYGSGVVDAAALQAVAALVAKELPTVTPKDERSDEIAWHLKALGSSGDRQYQPLIEEGLRSPNKSVAHHAETAMAALTLTSKTGLPLLTQDRVRMIAAEQAEHCHFIKHEECGSMRGSGACVSELQYQAIESGGDSYMLMTAAGRGWLMGVSMSADIYNCRGDYTKAEGDL